MLSLHRIKITFLLNYICDIPVFLSFGTMHSFWNFVILRSPWFQSIFMVPFIHLFAVVFVLLVIFNIMFFLSSFYFYFIFFFKSGAAILQTIDCCSAFCFFNFFFVFFVVLFFFLFCLLSFLKLIKLLLLCLFTYFTWLRWNLIRCHSKLDTSLPITT